MRWFFSLILWGSLASDALMVSPVIMRLDSNLASGALVLFISAILVWGYLIADS